MKKSKIILWDVAFIIALILFLSTKNLDNHNMIIGFETVLIFIYSVKFHIDYYKIKGRIY